MIPIVIISITLFSLMTFYNIYRLDTITFVKLFFIFSFYSLVNVVLFFYLEGSIVNSTNRDEFQEAMDDTFKNIDSLTTLKNTKKIEDKEFQKDKDSEKKNRDIEYYTMGVLSLLTIGSLLLLRYVNRKCWAKNLRYIIFNVGVIKIIQLYFIFTFKNNFKSQDTEEVRKTIIKNIKDV